MPQSAARAMRAERDFCGIAFSTLITLSSYGQFNFHGWLSQQQAVSKRQGKGVKYKHTYTHSLSPSLSLSQAHTWSMEEGKVSQSHILCSQATICASIRRTRQREREKEWGREKGRYRKRKLERKT